MRDGWEKVMEYLLSLSKWPYPGLGVIWQKMLLQVEQDENRDRQQLGKQQGVCFITTACCDNLCFEGFRSSLALLEIMILQPGAVKTVGSFMYSSLCFRGDSFIPLFSVWN